MAELRPIDASTAEAGHSQTEEEDLGMSYEELGHFGRMRKMSSWHVQEALGHVESPRAW